LNFREATIRTFERKGVDRIVWQPRICYWYYGNQVSKLPGEIKQEDFPYPKVPDRYRGKSVVEVHDLLNASIRYAGEATGRGVFRTRLDPEADVRTESFQDHGSTVTITKTPVGTIRTVGRSGYPSEFPVKTPADCEVMKYILDHTVFSFDEEAFRIADEVFGPRGTVQSFYPRSPFQKMVVEYMGARNFFIQLHRHQEEMEAMMDHIARWEDHVYEVLVNCPLEVLNFGENIDANLASPKFFERYLIDYYNMRTRQLHRAGKFCHIHIDGAIRPLLPLLDQLEFDGIEAATPKPQGDVEIGELKEGMGDKILLDGIPAVMFIPVYTPDQLKRFTREILETFSPNLILGVSDELPPTADIRMVELVDEVVNDFEV
jgi:hypothetical protein